MREEKIKIGAIQLTTQLGPKSNLKKIRHFLGQARDEGLKAVFLPECFYSLSNGLTPTPHLVEEGNEHYQAMASLAKDFSLFLLGGSAATREGEKITNRNYNFDPQGRLLGTYDKIHLFRVDLSRHKSGQVIDEAQIYQAGEKSSVLFAAGLCLGLSICFDLRFPELFRDLARQGANVLSVSSAFTVPTGKAHWHTLLRARAIENQCFVVAAAQWGQHNERISTYGHSLIVDPWGEVLADAGEGEKLISAELDFERLNEVRSRLCVF